MSETYLSPYLSREEYKELLDHYNDFSKNMIESFSDINAINKILDAKLKKLSKNVFRLKIAASILFLISVAELFIYHF